MGRVLRWDALCPVDNHDLISIKLFQLTVERTPEEESIDWTKIEPGVNFLKSPKGACMQLLRGKLLRGELLLQLGSGL